ncbi:MAG TPA: ribonuclease III [Ignavibacteriaceae bacterium]|nr:ribonuclease III [Ignavibacteriaceae bacterium]
MGKVLSWVVQKLKQRLEKRSQKAIEKVFTPEKFIELERLVGFHIKHRSYFVQALTHRSFLEQNQDYDVSNERLEFLGDSVLGLIVAEYLFDAFPDKNEGFLTKVRAKLVNKIALADAADKIKLGKFVLVSKNLAGTFASGSKTVLCDALEALIGAIYLDNGINSAKAFIHKVLIAPNTKEGLYLIDENFKSQLLEYAQAHRLENPSYVVTKEEGPQHNRIFTINVYIGNEEYGIGTGKNKKSAEQNAAHAALNKINNLPILP